MGIFIQVLTLIWINKRSCGGYNQQIIRVYNGYSVPSQPTIWFANQNSGENGRPTIKYQGTQMVKWCKMSICAVDVCWIKTANTSIADIIFPGIGQWILMGITAKLTGDLDGSAPLGSHWTPLPTPKKKAWKLPTKHLQLSVILGTKKKWGLVMSIFWFQSCVANMVNMVIPSRHHMEAIRSESHRRKNPRPSGKLKWLWKSPFLGKSSN